MFSSVFRARALAARTGSRFYSRRKKRGMAKKSKHSESIAGASSTGPKIRINQPKASNSRGAGDVNAAVLAMYEDKLKEAANRIKELETDVQEFVQAFSDMDMHNEEDLQEQGVPAIVHAGHPALVRVSDPVPADKLNSPELLEFVEGMKKAVAYYGGWGLAAPQVGSPVRVIVVNRASPAVDEVQMMNRATESLMPEQAQPSDLEKVVGMEKLSFTVGGSDCAGKSLNDPMVALSSEAKAEAMSVAQQVADEAATSPEKAQMHVDAFAKAALEAAAASDTAAAEVEAARARAKTKLEIVAAEAAASAKAKAALEAKAKHTAAILGAAPAEEATLTNDNKVAAEAKKEANAMADANLGISEDEIDLFAIVNPQITTLDGPLVVRAEGCLSVPGFQALVERPSAVRVTGLTPEGEPVDWSTDGWHACVLQHEVDHLNGELYVDKMIKGSFSAMEMMEGGEEEEDGAVDYSSAAHDAGIESGDVTMEDERMMQEFELGRAARMEEQMQFQMKELEDMKQSMGA
jgi:peptide deformylase